MLLCFARIMSRRHAALFVGVVVRTTRHGLLLRFWRLLRSSAFLHRGAKACSAWRKRAVLYEVSITMARFLGAARDVANFRPVARVAEKRLEQRHVKL